MLGLISQARSSLDNSGMHIFTAAQSGSALAVQHHFHCCHGANILPPFPSVGGWFHLISFCCFSRASVGNISLLFCFDHQKGSPGQKTALKASQRSFKALKHTVYGGSGAWMNLLAGHSTMLLTELSASSAHCLSAHSFRELTTQGARQPRPRH